MFGPKPDLARAMEKRDRDDLQYELDMQRSKRARKDQPTLEELSLLIPFGTCPEDVDMHLDPDEKKSCAESCALPMQGDECVYQGTTYW